MDRRGITARTAPGPSILRVALRHPLPGPNLERRWPVTDHARGEAAGQGGSFFRLIEVHEVIGMGLVWQDAANGSRLGRRAFAMQQIDEPPDVYAVFRELFKRQEA